jgi:hypothetical protein
VKRYGKAQQNDMNPQEDLSSVLLAILPLIFPVVFRANLASRPIRHGQPSADRASTGGDLLFLPAAISDGFSVSVHFVTLSISRL